MILRLRNVGVGGVGGWGVYFVMFFKVVIILFNKNVLRIVYELGIVLNIWDRVGDKKVRFCFYEVYNLGWCGGRIDRGVNS